MKLQPSKSKIMEITSENLFEKFLEAKERMFEAQGIWTLPSNSSEVNCGIITLMDGREAQVTLKINADQDEWL